MQKKDHRQVLLLRQTRALEQIILIVSLHAFVEQLARVGVLEYAV